MQSNQEPLVSFDQAKGLRDAGFKGKSKHYFRDGVAEESYYEWDKNDPIQPNVCTRPTVDAAIRWFRIEKNLHGYIIPEDSEYGPDIYLVYAGPIKDIDFVCDCDTHDVASSALLDKLIELNSKGHE